MVDVTRDIVPLTDFKRRTNEFVIRLKQTGGPVVLTVNGKPGIVLLDPAEYQRMRERLNHAEKAG